MKEKRKTASIVPGAIDLEFYRKYWSREPAKYEISGPEGKISQIILNAKT